MNNPADFERPVVILQSAGSNLVKKHEAFAELVRRFQDMAYGYAYGILGDADLAEDTAQEAFIAAYQNIGQLQNPGAFPGWLRRIVLTQCSRLIREQQKYPRSTTAAIDLFANQPDPLVMVESQELWEAIWAALQVLPENQRLAMILYYIDGYSQKEVAGFLEVSPPLVRKWLERARQKMRERMIEMVKDSLHQQRPSNSNRFAQAIHISTLMEAVKFDGQLETMELMLLDGFDPDFQGKDGQTLLHWAAQAGHVEAVEFLLKLGANAQIQDKFGKTPRQWAEEKGHQMAARLLN
jgi:RNA polymerase sigma factor (sigma-70 family)